MPSRRTVLASIGTTAIAAVGVGAADAANGDGRDDEGGEPRAALRLVHASLDAPAVDVSVDGDDDDLPRLERVDDLIPGESITVFVVGYATPEEEATSEGLGENHGPGEGHGPS